MHVTASAVNASPAWETKPDVVLEVLAERNKLLQMLGARPRHMGRCMRACSYMLNAMTWIRDAKVIRQKDS